MTIKEFYESINSSYDEAKSRLTNDAFILKFLNKFVNEYNLDSLNEANKNKDIKSIFSISHSLKGVVGNLSLNNLFNLISSICELARDKEEYIDIDLEELNKEYNRTVELIKTISI